MNVIVDANVLISFLLKPDSNRVPTLIVTAALANRFDLLISAGTINEITRNVASKPYLRERIPPAKLTVLLESLRTIATIMDELAPPIPSVTRDRKDDYLIAHALAEQVDMLVSGDRDLLEIDGTFPFRILTPAAFAATLEADETR